MVPFTDMVRSRATAITAAQTFFRTLRVQGNEQGKQRNSHAHAVNRRITDRHDAITHTDA